MFQMMGGSRGLVVWGTLTGSRENNPIVCMCDYAQCVGPRATDSRPGPRDSKTCIIQ